VLNYLFSIATKHKNLILIKVLLYVHFFGKNVLAMFVNTILNKKIKKLIKQEIHGI
jgi:hypothetical protein